MSKLRSEAYTVRVYTAIQLRLNAECTYIVSSAHR
jgi:hypothetical protein